MSRDGSGIYTVPAGTYPQSPNTTIESADWNAAMADLEQDANVPRPIVAGGTGSGTVAGAQTNLQIVPTTGGGVITMTGSVPPVLDSNVSQLHLTDSIGNTGNGGLLSFGASVAGGVKRQAAIKSLLSNGGNNGLGHLAFFNRAASTDTQLTERMRITSGGHIGINTDTPNFGNAPSTYRVLTVKGAGANDQGVLEVAGQLSADGNVGALSFCNTNLGTADKRIVAIAGMRSGADNSGAFIVYTFNAGVAGERLRITPSGLVGIGTPFAPAAKLHVNVAADQNIYLRSAAGAANIAFVNDAGSAFVAGSIDGLSLTLNNATGGLITAKGDITVLKNNPIVKLDRSGGGSGYVQFSNGATVECFLQDNSANWVFATNAGATTGQYMALGGSSWLSLSDARLPYKRTARDITDALPPLDSFRLYENEVNGRLELFTKAQEVHPLFPHVVYAGDDDENYAPQKIDDPRAWSMTYERLGAVALAYVKQLDARLKALEAT